MDIVIIVNEFVSRPTCSSDVNHVFWGKQDLLKMSNNLFSPFYLFIFFFQSFNNEQQPLHKNLISCIKRCYHG